MTHTWHSYTRVWTREKIILTKSTTTLRLLGDCIEHRAVQTLSGLYVMASIASALSYDSESETKRDIPYLSLSLYLLYFAILLIYFFIFLLFYCMTTAVR